MWFQWWHKKSRLHYYQDIINNTEKSSTCQVHKVLSLQEIKMAIVTFPSTLPLSNILLTRKNPPAVWSSGVRPLITRLPSPLFKRATGFIFESFIQYLVVAIISASRKGCLAIYMTTAVVYTLWQSWQYEVRWCTISWKMLFGLLLWRIVDSHHGRGCYAVAYCFIYTSPHSLCFDVY